MQRLLITGLLFCCCGCGKSDGLQRAAVNGKVTLDGAAIAEGSITFYPADGVKGPATGGAIKDGQYSMTAASGPMIGCNRVEIHASRKTGRRVQAPMADPGVMTDEVVEAIPSRYNTTSILKAEIKPRRNELDFPLHTK